MSAAGPLATADRVTLRDGTEIELRPLEPQDEPLLHDILAHMSAEDRRMRFFAPVRVLTQEIAARLSHVDYAHDMALIAVHDGAPLGVGRYFTEPASIKAVSTELASTQADRRRAEYAIAVRTDWKGRGVGYELMHRLIDEATRRGVAELFGEVLHENASMIAMCRHFGFTIDTDPNDASLVIVRKNLSPAAGSSLPH